jgi:sodium/potassium-transporting ATPase subunit beta
MCIMCRLPIDFNHKSNNTVDCSKGKTEGKSCKVDLAAFYPCVSDTGYEYQSGKPCIFLKLNKIYKWQPDYYTSANELPENMPEPLKTHITSRINKKSLEVVWVSCEGENPADTENLGKNVKYMSLSGEQGFNGNYFPFENTDGYLQPLIAVQFQSVKSKLLTFQRFYVD